MRNLIYSLSLLFLIPFNARSQDLISAEYLGTTTSFVIAIATQGLIEVEYDVSLYKIVYTTVDANGNPTIASGALSLPNTTECTDFPIAVYQHGTVLNKEDVPSRDNGEAFLSKILASGGYYAITPDYVGLGDSPGLHPYVHAESEATAAIDMMRAVRQFLNDSLGVQDNGEVFITGYSQGGHAAMALHKYIEDNNLLEEFDVIISAPASGPYAMSESQMDMILSNESYSNPGYLVYTISSYELVYGNIYDEYSDILQSPYDTIVVPFFDGNNTTLYMSDLNPLLPEQVQDLMQPDYFADLVENENNPLHLALVDNDNFNWVPERPITMYYCTEDEQVTFENTLKALDYMTTNGAENVEAINSGPFSHGDCILPSMTSVYDLFQSLKTPCTLTGIEENQIITSIYPNPVHDHLTIVTTDIPERYELLNALGQIILNGTLSSNSGQFELNVSDLENGVYFLRLFKGGSYFTSKSILKM